MEFPWQEYWRGLPFPWSEDLPDPRIEPTSPALAGRFFTTKPLRKPLLFSLHSPASEKQSAPDKSLNSHLSGSLSFVPQTLRLLVVPQDLYPTGPAIPCLPSNPSAQAQQGVRRIISDRMGPHLMTGSFRIL